MGKLSKKEKLDGVINLDSKLGKVKNRIALVGIELEGAWVDLPQGTNLVHDGSVRLVNEIQEYYQAKIIKLGPAATYEVAAKLRASIKSGELPSAPMTVDKISVWMKTYYPKLHNATCGMHVHMSPKTALHYQQLMVPSYPRTVVEYIRQWALEMGLANDHPIWERLSNGSRFCQHKFYAQEQVQSLNKDYDQTRAGHRYTVINYCYNRYGTVECRLLPMMPTVDLGIKAVQRVLDITNAFLVVTGGKEEKLVADMTLDGDAVTREIQQVFA